jgi:hypothetical protein
MPQLYWYIGQPGSDYGILAQWWNNNAYGRHIYIGIAAYKVNDPTQGSHWANPSQVPNQVRLNRTYSNIHGEVYFRSQHLRNNPLRFRDSLRLNLYKNPALLPTMSWRDNTPPSSPNSLTADKYANDSVVLNWTKPDATTDELDRVRQFAIYRSTETEIDITSGANLLYITNNDTTAFADTTVAPNTNYYYLVTALDRFHNESDATNTVNNLPPVISCPGDEQIILSSNCTAVTPDYRNRVSIISSASEVVVTQSPLPGTAITGRGNNVITLTATDKGGNTGICSLNLLAIDTTKPVITNATADPSVLKLPANHNMRDVTVSYTATDNCGPLTSVLSVKSNEPEFGLNDEDVGPDWEIIDKHLVKLRAERDENGKGRIYTVTITVTDEAGNVTTQDVTVTVPHHVTPRKITKAKSRRDNDEMHLEQIDDVRIVPNPTTTHFTLWLQSSVKESFTVRIIDNVGRVIETRNVAANSSITFGSNYKPGVYIAEIVQGKTRRTIKLIKSKN